MGQPKVRFRNTCLIHNPHRPNQETRAHARVYPPLKTPTGRTTMARDVAGEGIAAMGPGIRGRAARGGGKAPFASIDGAYAAARRRLPRILYEKVAGGS